MSDRSEDRLAVALAISSLDRLLAELDAVVGQAGESFVRELTRSNRNWSLNLSIGKNAAGNGQAARQPSPPAQRNGRRDPAGNGHGPERKLCQVHRKILAKATREPQDRKALLSQTRYLNSYGRKAIADLLRWGDLVEVGRGVALPDAD